MGRTPNGGDDAVDAGTEPETRPASLTEADLDFSTEEFIERIAHAYRRLRLAFELAPSIIFPAFSPQGERFEPGG